MDQAEGAIYPPPKDGLPFLVVTFAGGDIRTQSRPQRRSEARMLLSRERVRKHRDGGQQAEPQAVARKRRARRGEPRLGRRRIPAAQAAP